MAKIKWNINSKKEKNSRSEKIVQRYMKRTKT